MAISGSWIEEVGAVARKTERRHQQGEESRRAILDATLQIAAERGYDGTTVALVTERTGLPASSIYWHFQNKDLLLAATLEHSYRQWRAITPTWNPRIEPTDTRERVAQRFRAAAKVLITSPEFWSLGLMLTLQQRVKEPSARKLYFAVRRETEEAIRGWWGDFIRAEATAADPGLLTRLARVHMMLMDGMFLRASAEGATDGPDLLEDFAGGLVTALRQRGALS